jgi:signal transduction histidine kinase
MFHQKVQSEKMAAIGEMVSVLTHELKNPLGIIHSSAQYLLEGKQSRIVTKEMLYYIKNEVEHINQSIDSILKFARQKNPRFEKLDLLKQVGQLIEQWKQSEGHREDVDIVMDTPGYLPGVYADPGQIRQVLLNLVQNSEEMLGGDGLVTIAIEQENDFVTIRVIDNGSGIPDNNLDKVFDKFFTTKKNGVGLGLAVCRQIVGAHNGTISLKNRFAGGVETTVKLPVKPLTTVCENGVQEEINGA